MIYGDTSFLLALYHEADRFHAEALKLAARLRQPFALTLLGELELVNGLGRGLAAKTINQTQHSSILRQVERDEADGFLVRSAVQELDLYARARQLSRKLTPELSARSLDILHVAAAQTLRTTKFISFDRKQRTLAERVGLHVLPVKLALLAR
jgi:predicted nucleic acid-binding protein